MRLWWLARAASVFAPFYSKQSTDRTRRGRKSSGAALVIRILFAYTALHGVGKKSSSCSQLFLLRFPKKIPRIHKEIRSNIAFALQEKFF